MDLLVHSHILLMLCLEVWRERRVEESSGEENGYRLSCLNVFKIKLGEGNNFILLGCFKN